MTIYQSEKFSINEFYLDKHGILIKDVSSFYNFEISIKFISE